MIVDESLLRNLYAVIQQKVCCYLSEIPRLYAAQCGEDLKYNEYGFKTLEEFLRACEPYIVLKLFSDNTQYRVTVGPGGPPPKRKKTVPLNEEVRLEDQQSVLAKILTGGFFRGDAVFHPLNPIVCRTCSCLTGRFYCFSNCDHIICESCTLAQQDPVETCAACDSGRPRSSTRLPTLTVLQRSVVEQLLNVGCSCIFGTHAKPEPLTLRSFLKHYWRCQFNRSFTAVPVYEIRHVDSEEPDDDSDELERCSSDDNSFEAVNRLLHELKCVKDKQRAPKGSQDTLFAPPGFDLAKQTTAQPLKAEPTGCSSVPSFNPKASRTQAQGKSAAPSKVGPPGLSEKTRKRSADTDTGGHPANGSPPKASAVPAKPPSVTEVANLRLYDYVGPDSVDTRALLEGSKFSKAADWALEAEPGDILTLLKLDWQTSIVNEPWFLCRKGKDVGWAPSQAFRRLTETPAQFNVRMQKLGF